MKIIKYYLSNITFNFKGYALILILFLLSSNCFSQDSTYFKNLGFELERGYFFVVIDEFYKPSDSEILNNVDEFFIKNISVIFKEDFNFDSIITSDFIKIDELKDELLYNVIEHDILEKTYNKITKGDSALKYNLVWNNYYFNDAYNTHIPEHKYGRNPTRIIVLSGTRMLLPFGNEIYKKLNDKIGIKLKRHLGMNTPFDKYKYLFTITK